MLKKENDIVCFVSAFDILDFKSIIPTSKYSQMTARYELIKSIYPEAPIKQVIFSELKEGWECKCIARPEKHGFEYIFSRIEEVK